MAIVRDRIGAGKRAAWLKALLAPAAALGLVLSAAPAFAQFGGPCVLADLQKSTEEYLAAQAEGDPTKIHTGEWVTFFLNGEEKSLLTSPVMTPMKIDFHRTIYDTRACQSFTEVIVADPANPMVLGVFVTGRGGRTGSITMLANDKVNGWLFNPANTLKYSKAEDWGEIPEAQRDSRETIVAAANAYLDYFNDKTVQVPWGTPCARLEGGMYTGKGAPGQATPQDSCNVGVPDKVKLVDRSYVVDEAHGAVAVLMTFGNNQLPDIHTFRVEKGKLRYVHTITICKTFNCGFKLPDQLQQSAATK